MPRPDRMALRLVAVALFAVGALFCGARAPAVAQPPASGSQVTIGIGFGLAFLPLYVCEDLKLVEKYAKEAHLDVRPRFQRLNSAGEMQAALDSGAIEIAPFGAAPLLSAWGREAAAQILVVSGLSTMPLSLLGNQAGMQSVADLKPADRIAVPTSTSPQIYLLRMLAEKNFGNADKFDGQIVEVSHAKAIETLMAGDGGLAAYFASPPFTELALRDANIRPLLRSPDIVGGKLSFLMLGATKSFVDAQPQLSGAVAKAVDEAARLISQNPRRAAQIFLTHEPSGSIDGAAMEAIIRDVKDEFGSTVSGMQTMADFLRRHGDIKVAPRSWKEIVAPPLLSSSSS